MRKTKIIATIGPATNNYKTLKDLITAGINVVRLNLSHGTRDEHQSIIDLAKKLRTEMKIPLPIMLDTRGPEVRVLEFENSFVILEKGARFIFTSEKIIGNTEIVGVTQNRIIKLLNIGDKILANDGLVSFVVENKTDTALICRVLEGGKVSNNKSLAFPGVVLNLPYLNESDKSDILFGIKNDVEYIAASFVNSKDNIITLRNFIEKNDGNIEIIAKIESELGVKNIDKIIELSDGIMIARGDLGVELPLERIPEIQKTIIYKSLENSKMVITATEMLESMTYAPRPTRAETSDVANAVFDGTSVIMLSGETAIGRYPVETVETMSRIAVEAERNFPYEDNFKYSDYNIKLTTDALCQALVGTTFSLGDVKAIAVFTQTGYTARMISRFRPICPIVALTPNLTTFHRLGLSWGVEPFLTNNFSNTDEMFDIINKTIKQNGYAKAGDLILIAKVSGRTKPYNDMLKVHTVY